MSDQNSGVQTAVTDVKPLVRGRKAVILKNGKPLTEARNEAKAVIAAAKVELKAAKTVWALNNRAVDAADKARIKAEGALAKVEPKALAEPKNAEAKGAVTNAKAALKTAEAAHKTALKNHGFALKGVEKIQKVVDRAIAENLKIESSRLSS